MGHPVANENTHTYSSVPIARAGSIEQAGRKFYKFILNEQALLSEQDGYLMNFVKTAGST